jgi:hypothetical protein
MAGVTHMSLEWEWPAEWDAEFVDGLKENLQGKLRAAMEHGSSSQQQMRGSVVVESLCLGTVPPALVLKRVVNVSPTKTTLEVHMAYRGDASIGLKGLEINLDSCAQPEDATAGDSNHSLPFFCPFEVTVKNLELDALLQVEITHTFSKRPPPPSTAHALPAHIVADTTLGTPAGAASVPGRRLADLFADVATPPGSVRMLGARGSRGAADSVSSARTAVAMMPTHGRPRPRVASQQMRNPHSQQPAQPTTTFEPTFGMMANGAAPCEKRVVRVRSFSDPLQRFTVLSNFNALPAAIAKLEAILRAAVAPLIAKLMSTEGITWEQ